MSKDKQKINQIRKVVEDYQVQTSHGCSWLHRIKAILDADEVECTCGKDGGLRTVEIEDDSPKKPSERIHEIAELAHDKDRLLGSVTPPSMQIQNAILDYLDEKEGK